MDVENYEKKPTSLLIWDWKRKGWYPFAMD